MSLRGRCMDHPCGTCHPPAPLTWDEDAGRRGKRHTEVSKTRLEAVPRPASPVSASCCAQTPTGIQEISRQIHMLLYLPPATFTGRGYGSSNCLQDDSRADRETAVRRGLVRSHDTKSAELHTWPTSSEAKLARQACAFAAAHAVTGRP